MLGYIDEKIAECELKAAKERNIKTCPKCGNRMQKWYLLGGKSRWDCTNCKYKEMLK